MTLMEGVWEQGAEEIIWAKGKYRDVVQMGEKWNPCLFLWKRQKKRDQ
jgi:hypothetical protein